MAARNRPGLSENTRKRIQTTMIVKRLEDHILSKPEIVDGQLINKDLMTQSQVTAALGLIKKTLPDLQSTEWTGPDGGPLQGVWTVEIAKDNNTTKT